MRLGRNKLRAGLHKPVMRLIELHNMTYAQPPVPLAHFPHVRYN